MITINNQRLVKWCKRLESNKDSEYFKLFISNTRIRKPKRDYIFDCSIELVDELNNKINKARILYSIIKADKALYQEYLAYMPFTKNVIINTFYRKFKFPFSFKTYRKINLICDITEMFSNRIKLKSKNSFLDIDSKASLIISTYSHYLAIFKARHPAIYKYLIKKKCLNPTCMAQNYFKYIGLCNKMQMYVKNNIELLEPEEYDELIIKYREKFEFGNKVNLKVIKGMASREPQIWFPRLVKIRFWYVNIKLKRRTNEVHSNSRCNRN
jgi:hypothetical protein